MHRDIGGQPAGFDRVDRLGGRVDAHDQHFAGQIARGDGFDGAERHLVVGGEDGAQVGIAWSAGSP